ncbi:MAG TPA: mannose-1-phosphate guanyltransferase [Treponema sp.]|nr:mannose-1-phosphate guanyltransferase [Treponema sp.]HBB43596.1 mannose-1-phosphate guanyltransferase [Treponema sp.]
MSVKNFTDVVILAGGIGERLWPASQPSCPKQFMSLANGVSFLQAAILRGLSLNPSGKILIITRKDLLASVSEHCASLMKTVPEDQKKKISEDLCIIAEPCPRHTCAPIMLACKYLELTGAPEDSSILVLASDHVISPEERFAADCALASETARKGHFVCFAIKPNEPSTGYGYIKQGEQIVPGVHKIDQFKEKPDLETAKQYLESGKYTWNSGMFGFTRVFFENELKICDKDVYDAFENFKTASLPPQTTLNGIKYIADWEAMEKSYSQTPAIAVDNAIAERTSHAVAVEATFEWDDVGSWDAFERLFEKNSEGTVEIASHNSFVYSDIPVALCGVDDLVVVIKNGSALVMKKGSSGLMREVVHKVKEGSTKH